MNPVYPVYPFTVIFDTLNHRSDKQEDKPPFEPWLSKQAAPPVANLREHQGGRPSTLYRDSGWAGAPWQPETQ